VYVTLKDRSMVPVGQAQLSGDTLRGISQDGLEEPVALPMSAVETIEAKQKNQKRTTMMLVTLGVVGAGMVAGILVATGGDSCDGSYRPSDPTDPNSTVCAPDGTPQ
jgi:hypothetical protein